MIIINGKINNTEEYVANVTSLLGATNNGADILMNQNILKVNRLRIMI